MCIRDRSIDEQRDFIGRGKLVEQIQAGVSTQLVGLVLNQRGVLRAHYPVYANDECVGEITSGAFSPTLQHSIALARIKTGADDLQVEIRGKRLAVLKVSPPFARNGKKVFKLADA